VTTDSAFLACAVTAAAVLIPGPWLIRTLRLRLTERIDSASPELNQMHSSKAGTPTMGGLLILSGYSAGLLVLPPAFTGSLLPLLLSIPLLFAVIGAADDLIKSRTRRRGLSASKKLLLQLLVAVPAGFLLARNRLYNLPPDAAVQHAAQLSISLDAIWCAAILIATCNSVNLTDGLDGLAAGTVALISSGMATIIIWTNGFTAPGMAAAVLAVATASFLLFNRHPARIFMGDTGALATGAALATAALAAAQELLLPACGLILVLETMSVIAQVLWFRRTGRRLLLCSPLHNHFVFQKIPEPQIVRWFWLGSAAAVGLTAIGSALLQS
jgi:phospho-N-acetylmuramoyl-pentapeptide-transferase